MEYYTAFKNKEILPFATTQIDLEDIVLSECQTSEDKCCVTSLVSEL